MAEIAVLGGCGFLGSRLVPVLAAQGHDVVVFDRVAPRGTAIDPSSNVRVVVGDFMDDADLRSAVSGADYVFHLLSTTTPATADADPTLDVRTNVLRTIALLDECARAGVERFYFVSSGGTVYGPQGRDRYSEEDRTAPISPYGIGKLAVENYLDYFRRQRGLDSLVYRVSNPYGPGQRVDGVQGLIPIALRRIRDGLPVVRLGDGSMVRDYIYVDDVIRVMAALTGQPTTHSLYNVGSGEGRSVTEIIDILREATGVDFPVEERQASPSFVDRVVLDTRRLVSEIGPFATTDLRTGVEATWKAIQGEGDD